MIITTKTTKEQLASLSPPCRCKSCEIGCSYGGGILADEDISKIAKHLNISVDQLKKEYLEEIEKFHVKRFRPKIMRKENLPHGKCIFFDRGCTIHSVKPVECKVSSGCNGHGETITQWVLFNYFVNPSDPQSVREWASWLNDHEAIPGANLDEVIPDEERLKKILAYEEL